MSNIVLQCQNLVKKFDETTAINQVDLSIEKGKVYGLIGRNGAGKTTLLKLMSSLLFPTEGEILFSSGVKPTGGDIAYGRGYDIKYFSYKIKDIIKTASLSFPHWNKEYEEELVERFELDTKKNYHKSSSGAQTMTSLVLSLAADAKVLLLDEPYTGLDPINREVFYDFLRNHYFDGEKTVIISSHMIKEIEGYFERTIMIDKGKIVLNEDLDTLKSQSFIIQGNQNLSDFVERNLNILSSESLGSHCTYYVYDKIRDSERSKIQSLGGEVLSMDLQTLMVKMLMKGGAK